MAEKPIYEEDDGRTVADMSGVESPGLFRFRRGTAPEVPAEKRESKPWETDEMSADDRRVYIFAALRASLMIAAVFIGGLGLGAWLLLKLWS